MREKVDKIILHIGLAKTGTSAIQRFLFSNKNKMFIDYSILYPGNHENHRYLHALVAEDPCSLRQLRELNLSDSESIQLFIKSYKDDLLDEIKNTAPNTVIFSSEWLSAMTYKELTLLKKFFHDISDNLEIIAFVRDPLEFSLSVTQEMLRSGQISGGVKFGYMAGNIEILKTFEQVFNVTLNVLPYIERNKENSINRFMQAIGFDDCPYDSSIYSNQNPSMCFELSAILTKFNEHYPQFDKKGMYVFDPIRDWVLDALEISTKFGTPLKLSRESALRIYLDAKNDIDEIESRYFGGTKYFTANYNDLNFTESDDSVAIEKINRDILIIVFFKSLIFLASKAIHYYKYSNILLEKLDSMQKLQSKVIGTKS